VFTGDMLAGRLGLCQQILVDDCEFNIHLVVRTLCSFRCCWRLKSEWWHLCLGESSTTLAIAEVFEPSRDMNDRLWCIILRI
jgi:hypothetical protein